MSLQGHGDAVRRKAFLKHADLDLGEAFGLLHCVMTFLLCHVEKTRLKQEDEEKSKKEEQLQEE